MTGKFKGQSMDQYFSTKELLVMILYYNFIFLGSKILGLHVLEHYFVTLANHDQNVQSCFRLAQSMFMCKVGIECTA